MTVSRQLPAVLALALLISLMFTLNRSVSAPFAHQDARHGASPVPGAMGLSFLAVVGRGIDLAASDRETAPWTGFGLALAAPKEKGGGVFGNATARFTPGPSR